jgi:hypothetical protein
VNQKSSVGKALLMLEAKSFKITKENILGRKTQDKKLQQQISEKNNNETLHLI